MVFFYYLCYDYNGVILMDIERLVEVINNGNIAVVPTDTVYGIIGDATNIDVIHKVYEVKKRDYSKPLILMVSSIDMLEKYVLEVNDIEKKLIDRYWPGKLTILFKKNNNIDDLITCGSNLVGIRYPDNKELNELMNKLNKPLISTSCNISSKEVITSIDMLEEDISKHVSYVYDGGILSDTSSTIVRVNDGKIEIIRDGELSSLIREEFEVI
ncbi:MAG: threonylcarbamoyl-AMP synthase [Firmicutes bacterium]|nr:threonylcarbamoyl-AMP synthase [Bacillota bacterium]